MKVKILFFAELKEIFGQFRLVDIQEGTTIGEVVDLLASESDQLCLKKDSLVYAVNENIETTEKKLENDDELALMTPVSGGAV